MRCLECGTQIAGRAQVCARCGSWAPVEHQLYAAEDRAADAAYDAAGGRNIPARALRSRPSPGRPARSSPGERRAGGAECLQA